MAVLEAGKVQVVIEAAGAGKFSAVIDTVNKRLESFQGAANGARVALGNAATSGSAFQTSLSSLSGVATKVAALLGAGWASSAAMGLAESAESASLAAKAFSAAGGSMEEFRQQTQGMLSDARLTQKANLARTMGIGLGDVPKLAKIAQAAAATTGQSFDYLFDSIITGTARQSKMILDNLGLMINIDKANEQYAESLGKTASQLSDAEKKQAFLNAVLVEGERITQDLSDAGLSSESVFSKFSAASENTSRVIGSVLVPVFQSLFRLLAPGFEGVRKFGQAWDELNPKVKDAIGNISAVGIMVSGSLGAVVALTNAVSGLGGAFSNAFSVAATSVKTAVGPLIAFAVIAAGLASIAATIAVAWEENWGGIVQVTKSAFDSIKTFFVDLATDIVVKTMRIYDNLKWLAGQAKALFTGATVELEAPKSDAQLREQAKALIGDVSTTAAGTWDSIKGGAKTTFDFLERGFTIIGDKVKGLLGEDLFQKFTGKVSQRPAVQDAAAKAGGDSKSLAQAMERWESLMASLAGDIAVAQARIAGGDIAAKYVELGQSISKQISDVGAAAAAAGQPVVASERVAQQAGALRIANELNASSSLREFGEAITYAQEEALKAGVAWKDVESKLSFEPKDLSDLLSVRVSEGLGASLSAMELDIPASDRKALVATISDGLRDMLQGGRLDLGFLGQAFGRILGAANLGGIGDMITKAVGIGGNAGALAGPIGAIFGQVASNIGPMVMDGIKQVFQTIISALAAIPQVISQAAQGLAAIIPSSALGDAIQKAVNPTVAVFGLLASVATVLGPALAVVAGLMSTVLLPVTLALGLAMATLAAGMVAVSVVAGYVAAAMATLGVGTAVALVLLVGAIGITISAVGVLVSAAFVPLTIAVASLLLPAIVAAGAGLATLALAFVGFTATFALMAGLFRLALDTESFKQFRAAFEASIGRVVKALEPFFSGLLPLVGLFDALVSVVIPLASAFASTEAVARVMFTVLKNIAIGIGYAILGIGYFVSAVLAGVYALAQIPRVVAALLEGIGAVIDRINTELHIDALNRVYDGLMRAAHQSNVAASSMENIAASLSPNIDGMQDALSDLTNLTYDEAAQRARILAMERDAAEELTNIPQGFKVVAARFRAIAAEDYNSGVLGPDANRTGGSNFFIDQLQVVTDDPASLAQEIAEAAETQVMQTTGTTQTKDSQGAPWRR
jgi:hypothetical protein